MIYTLRYRIKVTLFLFFFTQKVRRYRLIRVLFLLFFQNLVRRYFRHCYKISVNEDSVIFIQVLFLIIFVQSGRRYYYLGVTIIRYLRVLIKLHENGLTHAQKGSNSG